MSGASAKGGPRQPSSRAGWGTISREQVVRTATEVVRSGGFKQMTIRSLAAELGVAPMSLYRHVRDKDDLLDEVVGRLLAEVWRPEVHKRTGRAWIAEAAERFRDFLVSQPAALHVYLRHSVVSPAATERTKAMVGVLRTALGDDAAAHRAYAAIHTYTVGFAALEAARVDWDLSGLSAESLVGQVAAYPTPRQFADGLGYLLDGIGLVAGQPSSRRPSSFPSR